MKFRILINLFLAYILLPLLLCLRDYIRIDIQHDQTVYSGTFIRYVSLSIEMLFLIIPSLFLISILLPYNIITLQLSKKYRLTLIKKVLIFELVLIIMFCLAGTVTNVWSYPYWENLKYVLYFIPISIICSWLIHLFADKEKQ